MVAAFSGLALRAVVPFARFGVYRRQRDLPERLVDLLNLNLDRVADVVLAFDLFYALPETELRDVHETVLRGTGNRHEQPEALPNADDLAGEPHPGLRHDRVRDHLDHLTRLLGAVAALGRDEDAAVVLDIDLGAGFGLDLVDLLALGADDLADLLDGHLHRDDLRSVAGQLGPRCGEGLADHVEDLQARSLRLVERAPEHIRRDAGELGVELQGRDELLRPCDLEVHVAVCVFGAQDVGQRDVLAVLIDQAHRDAGHLVVDRNAGVHQREG